MLKVRFKTALEKCKFYKKEVKFLGFVIRTSSIKIDLVKVQSIVEWPTPKNVTNVQAFLRLANYNRKFIKDYLKKAIPLTNLTKKDIGFR